MKKFLLIVSILIILAGCSTSGLALKEAIINGMETTSYESSTEISFSTNLFDDIGEDAQSDPLFQVMEDGFVIDSKQMDLETAYVKIYPKNSASIVGTELWPSTTLPAMELYVAGPELFVKSSLDGNYFSPASLEAGVEAPDEADEAAFTVFKQVFRDFLNEYNYPIKDVSFIGQESISLKNGETVQANHLQVSFNIEEAIDMLIYTLDNLSMFEGTDILASYGMAVTPEELTETGVKEDLLLFKEELENINTEEGYTGNFVFDFWIDEQKQMIQQKAVISIHTPETILEDGEVIDAIDFSVNVKTQNWNINEEVSFALPSPDSVITEAELNENPDLIEAFAMESPVRFFAELVLMPEDFGEEFSDFESYEENFGGFEDGEDFEGYEDGFGNFEDSEDIGISEEEAYAAFIPEGEAFADVANNHWAFKEITTLRSMEVVAGYDQNLFKPSQPITRAEFIKMMVDFSGYEVSDAELNFADQAEIPAWAKEYVQTAVKEGLIEGYDDQTVRPNQTISRSEMVAIISRTMEIPLEDYPLEYFDKADIKDWALPYVKAATKNNLITGTPDNKFAPNGTATRAEVATVLYRIMFPDEVPTAVAKK